MNKIVQAVTNQIIERSAATRAIYLADLDRVKLKNAARTYLPCSNLAHALASSGIQDRTNLKNLLKSNIAIVSAYNDMVSAHKVYECYPEHIRKALREQGAVGQMAGGVPAMCDGITQGEASMEMSLMSRDVIAMSVAISLGHNVFDGALYLGVCDKIVPGLFVGAMSYGHLPAIFVPAGPMASGLANKEKVSLRQRHSEGKLSDRQLLECEIASYHGCGTCNFYGTANSNQMVLELMGLHLPGAAFVPPDSPLRKALTEAAARQVTRLTNMSANYQPLGKMVDERVIVNGLVALLATGGSTNLTIHLISMAKAGGIIINWDDISQLSQVVPLLCCIYPNGVADINHFQAAGGTAVLVSELLKGGLLHEDVETVVGRGLARYCKTPVLQNGELVYCSTPERSGDEEVIATIDEPFSPHGGLKVVRGNLGRAIMKTSALSAEHLCIEAPAVVFNDQYALEADFKAGKLDKDCVVIVRFQGPQAIGMPELHKLITPLGVLQDRGFNVALVTDGRLSGASGKVPAVIHVSPEAFKGGLLSKVKNGDRIRIDGARGEMAVLLDEQELAARTAEQIDLTINHYGSGRQLFTVMRNNLCCAEQGADCFLYKKSL